MGGLADRVSAAAGPDEVSQLAVEVGNQVLAKSSSLVAVIEELQPVCTQADAFAREKGISFLVKLVEETKASLSPAEANVVVQYLISQFSEQLCVPHAARGCLSLLEQGHVSDESVVKVVRTVLEEVNVQSFQQTTRYTFFKIFELLVRRYLEVIRRELESDFLVGYISVMDGEKDPRNLMVAFANVYAIARVFDVTSCAQDLFEICFCYFPITFKPPPDDPYGITAADLKDGLARCLGASPLFAPFAIPCLLDKLESTNANAKRDALAVVCSALPTYGSVALLPHVPRLWKALKQEIFYSADAKHEDLALAALGTVLTVLSVTGESRTNPVDMILNPGVHECLQHLAQPETKLAKVSTHVLRAFVQADVDIATHVVSLSVPFYLACLQKEDRPSHQKTYVDGLVQLLLGCKGHCQCPPSLRGFANELFAAFFAALRSHSSSLQSLGLLGIFHEMSIAGLLSDEERGTYIRHVSQCLEAAGGDDSAKLVDEAIGCLAALGRSHPAIARQWVLPDLFAHIQRAEGAAPLDRAKLRALQALAQSPDLFSDILHNLVEHVRELAAAPQLIELLATVLEVLESATQVDEAHLRKVVDLCAEQQFPQHAIQPLADVAGIMMRKLGPLQSQTALLNLVFERNLLGQADTFPTFVAVIANAARDATLPVPAEELVGKVLGKRDALPSKSVAKLIGSLVNKLPSPDVVLAEPELASLLSAPRCAAAIELLAWVTKGLIMRGHAAGMKLASVLIDLLREKDAQCLAASELGVVVGESKELLNRSSHCIVKPLYKQRFFHFCLPKIIEPFHAHEDNDVYLLALGHLLQNVPQQVLLGSIKELIPLLLRSLSKPTSGDDLVVSSLRTITAMASDAPHAISDHVLSIVKLTLALCDPAARPMNVRISAVRCLGALTQLKFTALHPVKMQVIKGLANVLDDPKRIVRKDAVNCRSQWCLLSP